MQVSNVCLESPICVSPAWEEPRLFSALADTLRRVQGAVLSFFHVDVISWFGKRGR